MSFLRARVADPDPVFLPALDPDPVFKFIRIRFQPGFGSDPGIKKECRKGSKSDLPEDNLKIMTPHPSDILVDIFRPQSMADYYLSSMIRKIDKDMVLLGGRQGLPCSSIDLLSFQYLCKCNERHTVSKRIPPTPSNLRS